MSKHSAPANPSRRQFMLTATLASGALLVGCATSSKQIVGHRRAFVARPGLR